MDCEVMFVRSATQDDLPAIESLRRADSDSLGFVPKAKYEHIVNKTDDRGRERWRYESLWVCLDARELTGFCLAGFHRNGAKIEQIVVRVDARRMERALKLVDVVLDEARRRQSKRVRCRVAADIEANSFWLAVGFIPVVTVISTWLNLRESTSRRPLIVYDKAIAQPTLLEGI